MNPFRKRGNTFEINLIDKVRRYPYLYNSKDAHHVDSGLCLRTWQQIASEMNSTTLQCKAKWRVLRCNFIRAYRQHTCKSKTEDQGPDDFTRPKWVYFNHLMFLEPFIAKRRPFDRQTYSSQDVLHEHFSNSEDPIISPITSKTEPTVIELDDDNSQDNTKIQLSDSDTFNLPNMNAFHHAQPDMNRNAFLHVNEGRHSAPFAPPIFLSGITNTTNSDLFLNRPIENLARLIPNEVHQQQQSKPKVIPEIQLQKHIPPIRDTTSKLSMNGKHVVNSDTPKSILGDSDDSKIKPEDELFGKFVASVLTSITGRNKGLARMEIQQILFKYQYDSS